MQGLIRSILLPLALGACASDPQRPAPSPATQSADPTRYACDDGSFLSVRFAGEAALATLVDGSTVTLAQQPAGSGFRYASDRMELRGEGDAATWSVRGSAPTPCIAT